MNKPLLLAALLATAGLAHAEPATYAIEPTHTSVFFEAKHFEPRQTTLLQPPAIVSQRALLCSVAHGHLLISSNIA